MFLRRVSIVAATALLVCATLWWLPSPFAPARVFTAVTIKRSPEAVFDFVTTAGNWPRWHPSSLAVSGATAHSGALGEVIQEDFLVAGYRGHAHWTVVARQAPRRWVIEGKVDGGGEGTLTYRVTPAGGGARFEREFVYPAPNLAFALLDRLYVRARIERESANALQRLQRLLETREAAPSS
jgi:uncharacterized protein YndB with AHSA1/START domain